jgi:predicted nucleic acid-binding protein
MDCIIDVSFAACWFVGDEPSLEGESALKRHQEGQLNFHVPSIWVYEILNFLKTSHKRNRLTITSMEDAKVLLETLKLTFYEQSNPICQRRIFNFAMEFNLTSYDAAYLELADRLQMPLLTSDAALKAAAHKRNLATALKI